MSDALLLTLDGTFHDPQAAFLHADDLAAVRGDGIFETILIRDGRPRNVDAHLARLRRSAEMMELPAPDVDEWSAAVDAAAQKWGSGQEGLLRLVHSRGRESRPDAGATSYLTVGPVAAKAAAARADGIKAVMLDRGFSVDLADKAPWQLLGAKTLSYATNMASLRYAAAHGYDDVIFLSSEGAILEGPRSTVIAVYGNLLVTPPDEIGILPGTTAQAIFEVAEDYGWKTDREALRREDLIGADSVWLVSSITLAARVRVLNDFEMPEPKVAAEFTELVDKAIESR